MNPSKGLVFKANDDFENQTGDAVNKWYKTFASYNRASNQPSLSISYNGDDIEPGTEPIYRSLYYSKYDPNKYNTNVVPAVGSYTDLIQYRMNCYGYAFGFILEGQATITSDGGYKQQPGEFALTADKPNVLPVFGVTNSQTLMNNVVSNMMLDAKRLGYSIVEYTPSSSTVMQYGNSSRLIALVTGYYSPRSICDYHFYIQHNNGTWSHKLGSSPVTNLSIDTDVPLTNSNIQTLANQGVYATQGKLKFFVITKTAVVDYSHEEGCQCNGPCNHTQSSLFLREQAGDYLQTAKQKQTGSTSAKIDFAEDHDVYCFTATATRSYTVTTTCSSGANLDCKLYDTYGSVIQSDTANGQVSITVTLAEGGRYFFEIYNSSKTVANYTFSIS